MKVPRSSLLLPSQASTLQQMNEQSVDSVPHHQNLLTEPWMLTEPLMLQPLGVQDPDKNQDRISVSTHCFRQENTDKHLALFIET